MKPKSPRRPGKNEPAGKVGICAIVGRPNVGKSTLLNAFLGDKLAIVSSRPQTTRNRIRGVWTRERDQVVFLDTPGVHRRKGKLNRFLVREALGSVEGADCILLVTEVDRRSGADESPTLRLAELDTQVLESVRRREAGAPLVVVINKVDRVKEKAALLPLIEQWNERGLQTIVPTCALTANGVPQLLDEVVRHMPAGPLLYPADTLTDRPERFVVAEYVREQVFARCHREIPYSTAVEITRFSERPDRGDVVIEAAIITERESQKPILIGKGGAMIKAVGIAARQQIGQLLACPVHLSLTVRVAPNWTDSQAALRRLGYE